MRFIREPSCRTTSVVSVGTEQCRVPSLIISFFVWMFGSVHWDLDPVRVWMFSVSWISAASVDCEIVVDVTSTGGVVVGCVVSVVWLGVSRSFA